MGCNDAEVPKMGRGKKGKASYYGNQILMNNRQPNRRRGRGNNRTQQQNRGGGDYQNRIDNRARGNAAQMLEKYKKLANDAQLNGDRVQAEYYHQFADHYFRVLADAKARQEEQQAARQARWQERRGSDEGDYGVEGDRDTSDGSYDPYASQHRPTESDDGDDGDMAVENASDSEDVDVDGDREAPRRRDQSRGDRNDRNSGRNRALRERQNFDRRPSREDRNEARVDTSEKGDIFGDASDEQPTREIKRPARRPRKVEIDDAPATLDLAALPPAIGAGDEDAPVKKPRATRRPRKAEDVSAEAAE